ncbi:Nitrogen assimilation regulatory protein [Shewanella khirikhana]|uniref:Nitrogen assimilation regulatory protein n=1 Tax=Shewanella khirikhana TaxID=1965282 RepID=A0ABM7DNL0_9GAMM|nr:Nitrogen assimilation regulatory protein [Shewanella khirikhana]
MASEPWLNRAAALLGVQQEGALVAAFCTTLQTLLPAQRAMLFLPSIDGRSLRADSHLGEPDGEARGWEFEVDDFRQPLAHVLQNGKPMLLDPQTVVYWREQSEFSELSQLNAQQALLIYPMADAEHVLAVLCLWVDGQQAAAVLCENDWQDYSKVFLGQWQMLTQMHISAVRQSELSDSLQQMCHQQREAQNCEGLSRTLVGETDAMIKLRRELSRGAPLQLAVMIQGETGTGKEVVARAIHDLSPRAGKPFVAINCAAIPENLLESELFGYVKGAFSGADKDKKGLIAQAQEGTLFLDEIGDMPLNLQSKLLRVLESYQYRPVGGQEEVSADFRLVTATHVDLKTQIQQGGFRRDLYYRLCQYPLSLPPLRERRDDLPLLVQHFIQQFNREQQRQVPGIRHGAFKALYGHDFPGNVRELKNLIEYACALTPDHEEISQDNLPPLDGVSLDSGELDAQHEFDRIFDLKAAVSQFERAVIRSRLKAFNGDRNKAAMSLGLPKRTLSHKCQKLEITE